jgi:hypothetical protein
VQLKRNVNSWRRLREATALLCGDELCVEKTRGQGVTESNDFWSLSVLKL